jgi:cullin 3
LDPDEPLTVNLEFTSKLLKVKVPLISAASLGASGSPGTPRTGGALDETEEEGVQAQIASQRKTMVEASVVRIMKARKSLDLSTLVAEVMRQLAYRFEPTTADIKKRIEDLIERDYLERDGACGPPAARKR